MTLKVFQNYTFSRNTCVQMYGRVNRCDEKAQLRSLPPRVTMPSSTNLLPWFCSGP
jgi:hypothetical protein